MRLAAGGRCVEIFLRQSKITACSVLLLPLGPHHTMDPGHAREIPLHPGDLFDADYEDCPFQTCMRDGEIANLDATCDLTDADVVHVTWEVTDPTT